MKVIKKLLLSLCMVFLIAIIFPINTEAASLRLAKKTVTINVGKKYAIAFKNEPEDAEIYYTYSTKSKYIKVSKSGVIKPKNYPGKTAKVNIKANVITTDDSGMETSKIYKFTLKVKIKPRDPNAADYDDAESFEDSLNSGKNLVGKTVRFKVKKMVPNSAFGYNMQAGEHLNFCSPTNPNKKSGSIARVRVKQVISFLGSYIIYYTDLK